MDEQDSFVKEDNCFMSVTREHVAATNCLFYRYTVLFTGLIHNNLLKAIKLQPHALYDLFYLFNVICLETELCPAFKGNNYIML